MSRPLKFLLFALGGLSGLGLCVVFVILVAYSRDLPNLDTLKNYTPMIVTTVYSDDGRVVAEFSAERRKFLNLQEMPKNVVNAFVAAEDADFYSHKGVNPISILRAAIKDFLSGHKLQGGSTITQQVAKSMLLTPERSFSRKVKELLLAFRIEKTFKKDEIINLYLNHIFFGEGAYGIEAAAQTYFGKAAKDLSVAEAAILAGLPRAPSRDNPVANPKAAKQRQVYVLGRMQANGMITRAAWKEALEASVQIKNRHDSNDWPAPYFTEHVRRYLMQKYGAEQVYGGGLKVYTTMNYDNQMAAQDAIKVGLQAVDKRTGMRAPTKTLPNRVDQEEFLSKQHVELVERFYDYKILSPKGDLVSPVDMDQPTPLELGKNYPAILVEKDPKKTHLLVVRVGNRVGVIRPDDYKWASQANPEEVYKERSIRNPYAQLKVGDVITVQPRALHPGSRDEFFLEQESLVQGSLLSYRLPDGAMLAMVGGYDFKVTKSEFNRATQAVRQPGSAFKPIVYAAALDSGLTPSTIIVDSPIVYRDADEKTNMEKVWRPENFGEKFYGDTTLRNAITFSRNIPTIKLLQHLRVGNVIDYARKLGITSKLNPDLSLALGSNGLTLEELMYAWGPFTNHGNRLKPYYIKKVEDRNGQVLEEHQDAPPESVIPDSTAFLITSLLQGVVESGTGTAVKPLGRPIAGKTGTTSDSKDVLFLGYIPQIFTGVWVGFDEDRPIGRNETGGRAAAPIWLQYMQVATAKLPVLEFEAPPTVTQVQVDGETGDLPTASTRKRITEWFANGTAPGQVAPTPTPGPDGKITVAQSAAAPGTVNHTKVITGNTESTGSPVSGGPAPAPANDVNADELMRDNL